MASRTPTAPAAAAPGAFLPEDRFADYDAARTRARTEGHGRQPVGEAAQRAWNAVERSGRAARKALDAARGAAEAARATFAQAAVEGAEILATLRAEQTAAEEYAERVRAAAAEALRASNAAREEWQRDVRRGRPFHDSVVALARADEAADQAAKRVEVARSRVARVRQISEGIGLDSPTRAALEALLSFAGDGTALPAAPPPPPSETELRRREAQAASGSALRLSDEQVEEYHREKDTPRETPARPMTRREFSLQ